MEPYENVNILPLLTYTNGNHICVSLIVQNPWYFKYAVKTILLPTSGFLLASLHYCKFTQNCPIHNKKKKILYQPHMPWWPTCLFPFIAKLIKKIKMLKSTVPSPHFQFFLKLTDIWFIIPLLCCFFSRGHQWLTIA